MIFHVLVVLLGSINFNFNFHIILDRSILKQISILVGNYNMKFKYMKDRTALTKAKTYGIKMFMQ